MIAFVLGLLLGVGLTVPIAVLVARRRLKQLRLAEQRARASERLAELGTLTSGLAHEIKNPLSTINLNLQLLQEDLEELLQQVGDALPERDREDGIQRIERRFNLLARETQRLRDILGDFLQYAGRMKLQREPCELNGVVDEVADFFMPQAEAAKVHLRVQFGVRPAQVHADCDLLKQALLNLMLNAVQAMQDARQRQVPHGGADELLIRTDRRSVLEHAELLVHVIDTGPGIAAEDQENVLKPYVSKRRGGTGLGLPRARRIIEEHGGTLSLHSELGRGTEFTLALPEHAPEPEATGDDPTKAPGTKPAEQQPVA